MKATEILKEEHEVIVRILNVLEKAAHTTDVGKAISPKFYITSADFIRGFADGCHHLKEEGVLFPVMINSGVQNEGGPIGVMLAEHEQGRLFTREMRTEAEKWIAGDTDAKKMVTSNALSYVALLRSHIYKENNILFPMADKIIPESQVESLTEAFEHVEHEETGEGVHEKYLAMAEELEGLLAGF
jgi:hemerythrin-like domain-containing protein